MKRRLGRSVLVAALVVPALGGAPHRATNETYAFSTYIARAEGVTVLVDSFPASLHDDDDFVPLHVAVGLGREHRQIELTRESFTLVDSEGRRYPEAAYGELLKGYHKLEFDRALLRQRPLVVGELFTNYHRVDSDFYPTPGTAIRIDRVELDPFTWFEDVIYFPRPAAGLGGVLRLRLAATGIEHPIEVAFRVPLRKRETE